MMFNNNPSRPKPLMPSGSYKTYAIRSPLSTHYRKASCAEVNCEAYLNGWTIPLAGIEEQLEYVARHSGKRFREVDGADYGVAPGRYLVFEPGQACFMSHTHVVSLERPEFFFVGRGDHRSFSVRKARQHANGSDWQDDMANHLDGIRTEYEHG